MVSPFLPPVFRSFRPLTMACALAGMLATACGHETDGPTPSVAQLEPQLVCVEQLTTEVTIHGEGLSPTLFDSLGANPSVQLPRISLIHELDLSGAPGAASEVAIPDDPTDPAASRVRWVSQSEMRFDIYPELQLMPGVWGLRVMNPSGASVTASNALLGVEPPRLDAVEPDSICTAEGSRTVILRGANFLVVDGTFPSVDVGDIALAPTFADEAADCLQLPGPLANIKSCTALQIEIPEDTAAGSYLVSVTNPAPAGCSTTTPQSLFIVEPPTLLAIEPVDMCASGGDTVFTVNGAGFLDIDGNLPVVSFNDGVSDVYQLTPVAAQMQGCTAMDGPIEVVRVCSSFVVTLPQDAAATATTTFDVRVTNPDPAGCSSGELPVTNHAPPTLTAPTSGAPALICQGGGRINVRGTSLRAGATVRLWEDYDLALNGIAATSVEPSNCDAQGECTAIAADFGFLPTSMISAPLDLAVENADACEAVQHEAVVVSPGILLLYADPPVIYDGFDNTLTVYATNAASDDIVLVELVPPLPDQPITLCDDNDPGAVPCTSDLSGATSGAFNAVVPAGTLGALIGDPTEATFSLRVQTAGLECQGQLVSALRLVSVPEAATMQVSPGFGRVGEATAINIDLTTHPEGVTFVATPRAYLTTTTSGGALRAVSFVSGTTLTAVVPETFTLADPMTHPFEDFGLTVVNPDGTLFIQALAFRLSSFDPPRIEELTPGQLPAGSATSVQVTGSGFSSAPSDPTVTLMCQDATGTPLDDVVFDPASVTVHSAGSITLAIPATFGADTSCIVEVRNSQDGAFDRFSALVFGNSSGNIPEARLATATLNEARHAHGLTSVAATRAAHFLYAAGGRDLHSASVTSAGAEPFALADGLTLTVRVDGGAEQTATFNTAAFLDIANATAAEVTAVLSGAISEPIASPPTFDVQAGYLIIRSGSTAAGNSIKVTGGTANTILGFPTTVVTADPRHLSSVEYSATSLAGEPSGFTTARYGLAAAREYLGFVRAGRALYAVGGADQSGIAQATVERAVVLDAAETVRVGISDFQFASPGLPAGGWIYRVAIVYAPDDPINPCGESLPSEPFVINLPDVADESDATRGLTLTLAWVEPSVDNLGPSFAGRMVGGYRVYRTPDPDEAISELAFLNDVDGAASTTYVDDGAEVSTATIITGCADPVPAGWRPLSLGETSKWVSAGVPQLSQARKGAGIASVSDRLSSKVFLYAMSGLDETEAALNDYELLVLDYDAATNPADWEASASWTQIADALAGTCSGGPTGRWQAGLFVFNKESSSRYGTSFEIDNDEQYLYLGPGIDIPAFESWLVDPTTGELDAASYDLDCKGGGAATGGYGNIGVNQQTSLTVAPATAARSRRWSGAASMGRLR